jgi:hypothetical protein
METIKDFDKLIPDKRIAILAGKEFDVSKISTRLALQQSEFQDNRLRMGEKEALKKAVAIVAKVCGKPKSSGNFFSRIFNRAIDEKWLINNTNYEQLVAFINFVLEPLMGKEQQVETPEKKN